MFAEAIGDIGHILGAGTWRLDPVAKTIDRPRSRQPQEFPPRDERFLGSYRYAYTMALPEGEWCDRRDRLYSRSGGRHARGHDCEAAIRANRVSCRAEMRPKRRMNVGL